MDYYYYYLYRVFMSEEGQVRSADSSELIDEFNEELENYTLLKTLGKGNFGKVKLGIHKLTSQKVAIKILEKELIFQKTDIQRISREIKIMKMVRHPYIIQLYQIIQTNKRLYLIMEYGEGGDLFDLIVKSEKLREEEAAKLYAQIIYGVEYLHSKGITHRDLKPENILMSEGVVKLADFGLGNFFHEGQTLKTACGSPCYASPEMLSKMPYNPEGVDVWSSGVMLYAMVCGYLPFQDSVTPKLYEKIKNNVAKFPRHLSDNLKQTLRKLLEKDPCHRITIDQLKHEPWLEHAFIQCEPKEFEVQEEVIQKINEEYETAVDQQKLISYLKKNKHNNLTTLYYLSLRKDSSSKVDKSEKNETKSEISNDVGDKHDKNEIIKGDEKKQSPIRIEQTFAASPLQHNIEVQEEQIQQNSGYPQNNGVIKHEDEPIQKYLEEKQRENIPQPIDSDKNNSVDVEYVDVSTEEKQKQKIWENQQKIKNLQQTEKEDKAESVQLMQPKPQNLLKHKILKPEPKLKKNSRMPMESKPIQPKKKHSRALNLNERSTSKDHKPISLKKLIGKSVSQEPYLINPSFIVCGSWQNFSSFLRKLGGEGKIQYYSYKNEYIVIVRNMVRGIGSLSVMIDRFNAGL